MIAGAVSACSGLHKDLIEPKVNLQNVQVTDPTFSEATLVFHFQVENPNTVPLEVDKVNYNLKLNGKAFTSGVLDQGLKVDSKSSAVIPLPVRVKYADLASSITTLLSQGSTPYELDGSVKVGWFSVPFKKDGEVKLQE